MAMAAITERSFGPWRFLRGATVYDAIQGAVGTNKMLRRLVADHIRPRAGMRVLDLGCGTGQVTRFLDNVDYTGIDNNPRYIAKANAENTGRYICDDFSVADSLERHSFDLVLAIGLLHHLDARQAAQVFAIAARRLIPCGRMVTIDPAHDPSQGVLE